MFESVTVERGQAVEAGLARDVLRAFDLPEDALSLLRLRTLMRKRVRFGDQFISVEAQQFLDRVRNTGYDIALPEAAETDAEPRDLSVVPRYEWTKNYLPRRVKAGTEFLGNMRLENRGPVTLYRSGQGEVRVVIKWRHRSGEAVEVADERTPLPIDLEPGHAVTLSVRVTTPAQLGRYLMTVTLVQEQLRWLDDDSVTIPVTVEQEAPDSIPDGWLVLPDPPADYDSDHVKGRSILQEWLQKYAPPHPRLLEIGGNAVPMLGLLEGAAGSGAINVDVDLLGLQVGRMVAQQTSTQIHQLCADAFNLPFPKGYFDAIVIFASLHHFPDPAALLEHLRRKLRPGGFIGLFCEPVGHIWPGHVTPAFLAELQRGVNEQSFSLREYEMMFRQAELSAAEVVVDLNSLKVRLICAEEHDRS